ncbi:MAG: hypothetical protein ACFCU8_04485 [Thermosynechococcaceae cyanobacterium]
MKKRAIRRFLKPDWKKLLLFSCFMAIAIGGKIQAWAFSDIPPKPFLYDLLQPFPLWSTWMLLLSSLTIVSLPFRFVGIDLMGRSSGLFVAVNGFISTYFPV